MVRSVTSEWLKQSLVSIRLFSASVPALVASSSVVEVVRTMELEGIRSWARAEEPWLINERVLSGLGIEPRISVASSSQLLAGRAQPVVRAL